MDRILNITHHDPDGCGAAVAIKLAHPSDHIRVKALDVYNVPKTLYRELTSSRRSYKRVILSDCSIKIPGDRCLREPGRGEDVSEWELINNLLPVAIKNFVEAGGEFVVLDHHPTAIPMLEYYNEWLHPDSILEEEDSNGVKRAGSELAQRYLENRQSSLLPTVQCCRELMELLGDLDCWRDPLGLGGDLALGLDLLDDPIESINILTELVHDYARVERDWTNILARHSLLGYLIPAAKSQLTESVRAAKKTQVDYPGNISTILVDKFASLVSLTIYTETKGIVVLTYPDKPNRISLRGHESTRVHLGNFAREFGGGGHALAAGMNIPADSSLEQVISKLEKYED